MKDGFSGQIHERGRPRHRRSTSTRVNGATGPVAVRGAEPGDSLVVEILDVRPGREGRRVVIPGVRPADRPGRGAGDAHVRGRGRDDPHERADLASRPGRWSASSAWRPAARSSANGCAGRHGGNLDNHLHGHGAKIYFPCVSPAACSRSATCTPSMGDGEICGTGVEIAGEVDIRFDAPQGQAGAVARDGARRPLGRARDVGAATSARRSSSPARRRPALLVDEWGFSLEEAFIFLSVACDVGHRAGLPAVAVLGTIARFAIPKIAATARSPSPADFCLPLHPFRPDRRISKQHLTVPDGATLRSAARSSRRSTMRHYRIPVALAVGLATVGSPPEAPASRRRHRPPPPSPRPPPTPRGADGRAPRRDDAPPGRAAGGTLDPQINYTLQYWQLYQASTTACWRSRRRTARTAFEVVPDLAEEMPKATNDGKT